MTEHCYCGIDVAKDRLDVLLAADLSVRRINPNKLRQFGRARGVLAKNDRLDARLIAEYVAHANTGRAARFCHRTAR